MKFYKDKIANYYGNKIIRSKLSAVIYTIYRTIIFFKNAIRHNSKNAAFIADRIPDFWFNGNFYGSEEDFTKESWRRFIKLQTFL